MNKLLFAILALALHAHAANPVTMMADPLNAAYKGPKDLATWKATNGIGSANFPNQATHAGEYLSTNGTNPLWMAVPAGVPSVTGQTGKVLTNNGTTSNWAAISTLLGANLQAFSGLTGAADKLPYFTGAGTMDVTTLTAFGRSLIDDADNTAARVTLGLRIGIDVQSYSTNLDAITGPGIAVISRPTLTFNASQFGGKIMSLLGSASGSIDLSTVDAAAGSHTVKFQSVTGIAVVGAADNDYFGTNNFVTDVGTGKVFTISGDGNFFVGNTGQIAIAGFSTFDIIGTISVSKVNGTGGTNVETDHGFTAATASALRDVTIFSSAAGATGLDVVGALGQTVPLAIFSDNSDADAITITKDIDLDMGGNQILNAHIGAHSKPFVTKTANYTVTTAEDTIYANAAGGSFTITLPAPATTASGGYSYCYRIKRVDTSGNTVSVVVTGGVLMDTYATLSLAPWQSVDLQSNGTIYLIH